MIAQKYIKRMGQVVGVVWQAELHFNDQAKRDVLGKLRHKRNGLEMQSELIRMGYDGLVDDYMDEIVVFFPKTQIKGLRIFSIS